MNRFTSLGTASSIDVVALKSSNGMHARKLSSTLRNLLICLIVAALGLPATVAQAGNLYVTYDAQQGVFVREFTPTGMDLGNFTNTFGTGNGIVFDANGNLYVACSLPNEIHKFSPTGADLGIFASYLQNGLRPFDLAFDSTGNLYVSGSVNGSNPKRVDRFSPTGASLGTFVTLPIDSAPTGIAFDSSGNLYVADSGEDNIHRYGPTGANLGTFATAGLGDPTDIAFDAIGNVYVSCFADNTIEKFGPTGAHLVTFNSDNLNGPAGLAFGPDGSLFVANFNDGAILRFSTLGTDLGLFASTGTDTLARFLAFSPVPEPGSFTLLGLASVAVLLFHWSYRRRETS